MRPRLFSGERIVDDQESESGGDASMRPRLFSGERNTDGMERDTNTACFNEAPLIQRGKEVCDALDVLRIGLLQ